MISSEIKNVSNRKEIISEDFLKFSFNYWFSNHDHIRSPFPVEIRALLKENTTEVFFEWIFGSTEDELGKIEEDEFAEMFETILFNEAMKLVEDEDQKLTIAYPFLPRIGDKVKHDEKGEGVIKERKGISTKENKNLFELTIFFEEYGEDWKTEFELTE